MFLYKDLLKISPLVSKALKHNKPVVALQSTIISHGMPYPNNKHCALQVQSILRDKGVEPATIALINGYIHIGLNEEQIELLARKGSKSTKVSRRDLPYVLAQKILGSTTVAGTMICSALAGIEIFVTGGLGGVHRGYEQTMDVSADLRELGRTPVTVISAGVKNILDIPRTLEYLQTEGVPVVTYNSKYFPAFFAPSSGIISPISFDKIEDIAEMLVIHKRLALQNGVLVAVPNPNAQNGQQIEKAIQQALKQAQKQGIKGAATTPFLLKRVHQLTDGASIRSNISLVKHNAEIGASLALEYHQRLNLSQGNSFSFISPSNFISSNKDQPAKGKLIVIGGAAIDYEITVKREIPAPPKLQRQLENLIRGVGRNISEAARRLGTQSIFITAIGGDSASQQIQRNILSYGIELKQIKAQNMKAATFLGILDDSKDSIISISDMDINKVITLEKIKESFFSLQEQKGINKNDIVIVDTNIQTDNDNLLDILKYLNQLGYFIVYECKGRKTIRIVESEAYKYISLLKMNQHETELFLETVREKGTQILKQQQFYWLSENISSKASNTTYTDLNVIITRGPENITLIQRGGLWKNIQVNKSNKVIKTIGAGDTMTGTICSMLLRGESVQKALSYAIVASKMTVQGSSKVSAISDDLTLQTLELEYAASKAANIV